MQKLSRVTQTNENTQSIFPKQSSRQELFELMKAPIKPPKTQKETEPYSLLNFQENIFVGSTIYILEENKSNISIKHHWAINILKFHNLSK